MCYQFPPGMLLIIPGTLLINFQYATDYLLVQYWSSFLHHWLSTICYWLSPEHNWYAIDHCWYIKYYRWYFWQLPLVFFRMDAEFKSCDKNILWNSSINSLKNLIWLNYHSNDEFSFFTHRLYIWKNSNFMYFCA